MKHKLINLLATCLLATMACSCSDSKYEGAVSMLGALPVFFNEDRVNQSVTYEGNEIKITIPYQPASHEWYDNVTGDDWVVPLFFQKLLGNNIAAYTIGQCLEAEKGTSPIEEFLTLSEEKNITFVVSNGSVETILKPNDIRQYLNDDAYKYMFGQHFAKQLKDFANDYNEVLQEKGLAIVNASKETSSTGQEKVFIDINCIRTISPKDINDIAVKSLKDYAVIPSYCYHNNLSLAFRYHVVSNMSEVTSNSSTGQVEVFDVPQQTISEIRKDFKKKAEQAQ